MSKYDKEWSQLTRMLNPWCEVCKRQDVRLNAHHYIRRSVKSTRLVLENAVILCTSHHVFNHRFSAHKTPESFRKWFKKKYPARARKLEKKEREYMNERQAIIEFISHPLVKSHNDFYKERISKRIPKVRKVQRVSKKNLGKD